MSAGTVREGSARPCLPPPLQGAIEPSAPAGREASGPASAPATEFAAVLAGLGQEVQRGESLVRSALASATKGTAFGPAELIALQAGVYRYGEAIDLTSRLIDRAAGAVKTVLQGQ